MTKSFRPQYFSGKYKLRNRNVARWHWHHRRNFDSHLYRVFGQLHYLGEHAPLAVRKKWWLAWDQFYKKHQRFIERCY